MDRINMIRRTALSALALGVGLGTVGCSSFESTSHLVEPEPGVSLNAVASADDGLVAMPFSLVAADSIGLSTFGQQVVMDEMRIQDGSLADVQP